MKRIFIAGATGFLGRHILNELVKSNKIYISLRDFRKIDKKIYNFKNLKCFKKQDKKLSFDFLINCIANTNTQSNDWEEIYKSNCLTNIKLLKNLKYNCFIYFSSFSVFSKDSIKKKVADPNNFYGLSKYLSEKIIEQKSNSNKISIVLRLPIVIGKTKKQLDIINYFHSKLKKNKKIKLFNKGKLKKNIIHYNEVVLIIKSIIKENPFKKKFNIYHLNSSNLLTVNNICQYMKKKIKSKSKIVFVKNKNSESFNSIIIKNSIKVKNYKEKKITQNLDNFMNEFL